MPAVNAQEELTDSAYNSPVEKTYDSEKFAFPSNDDPVPTYSVTFGSGQEVPPPSQMRFSPPRSLGPRFYSGSSQGSNPFETPFETPPGSIRGASPTGASPLGALPSSSVGSAAGYPGLTRQTSRSSQMSHSSTRSAGSTASKGSANSRRWVIE